MPNSNTENLSLSKDKINRKVFCIDMNRHCIDFTERQHPYTLTA